MLNISEADDIESGVARPNSAWLAERIGQAIRNGSPAPGGHLSEYELARRYETSRTPVRHALNLLALQDLVIYREHRGYFVREMTLPEILGRLRVRAAMEGLAARIVASRGISKEERGQLRDCLLVCDETNGQPLVAERFERYMAAVDRFHRVLRSGADNALLQQTTQRAHELPYRFANGRTAWLEHERLATYVAPLRMVAAANLDRARVVDAIEERNGQRAESMIREHMFSISQTITLLFNGRITAPDEPPPS